MEQISAIRRIKQSGMWDSLSDKLKAAAEMRLANPESNLAELAAMFTPPLTKSCLAHRMKKIGEISNNGAV